MANSEPTEPQHVGCPWCVRGYAPAWRHDTQEYVHTIRERFGDNQQHERVTVTVCEAFARGKANG